ncbi:MAG TPA: hypothetical protein VNG91_08615 [Terriglobia bacterium]|nr:hypothetical protein [Terriglobia bacterium]
MKDLQSFPAYGSGTYEEVRALVERILASPVFEKSARLRDFLRYICDRALEGHPEEVHEQLIGHRVFNRPTNYNPADENIVRVSARQLRTKLHEYFDTDGQGERWLVEIPKGGYLPVFRDRGSPSEPSGKVNTVKPIQPAAPASFVADLFAVSEQHLQIVVSDSALVLMQTLVRHRFTLEQYADRSYRDFPQELSDCPDLRSFWNFLGTRQLLNIGDMGAANRFLISMRGRRPHAVIRNARNMTARDFMSGNFVLLGSSYSNPWTQLFFDRRLNFQFAADELGGESEIRNLVPGPEERGMYSSKEKLWESGVTYAHIALLPNLTHTGRVLLIAGISMEATEAAAGFLLNPSSSQEVLHVLGTTNTAHIPDFELLLETSALEGTPNSARLIAHRVYPQCSPTNVPAQRGNDQ